MGGVWVANSGPARRSSDAGVCAVGAPVGRAGAYAGAGEHVAANAAVIGRTGLA